MVSASLIAWLLAAAPGCGLPPPRTAGAPPTAEALRYEVRWNGVAAGEARVGLAAVPGGVRASLEARQTRLGGAAFRAESLLAPHSRRPGRFSDVEEGLGERRATTADLGWSPISIRVDWRLGDRAGCTGYRRGLEVLDFASAIPYLAAAELAPGAAICFDVVGATQLWRVEGSAGGVEEVRTPAGTYQALRLGGTLRRADGRGRSVPLRRWIDTGAARLPVAAEVDGPVGRLRAVLVDSAGVPGG